MHRHAQGADEGEEQNRPGPSGRPACRRQQQEVSTGPAIELALAVRREPEARSGSSMKPAAARRRRQDIEQDLEAVRPRGRAHDAARRPRAAIMKKPLIGSVRSTLEQPRRARLGEPADRRHAARPAADAAARRSGCRPRGRARRLAGREHGGQQRLVVLQVGVHHRDARGRGGEHALDQAEARPRRPTRRRQRTRGSRRASSRTASAVPSGESSSTNITSQARPAQARRRAARPAAATLAALVEGRDDDGELGRPPARPLRPLGHEAGTRLARDAGHARAPPRALQRKRPRGTGDAARARAVRGTGQRHPGAASTTSARSRRGSKCRSAATVPSSRSLASTRPPGSAFSSRRNRTQTRR